VGDGSCSGPRTRQAPAWTLVDHEDAVEQFAADAADEPFGPVGPGRTYRCLDYINPGSGKNGVGGGSEVGVQIADEKLEPATCVVEIHREVAGELGGPCPGWMGGQAEDVYAAGGVLDGEEGVEPMQGDGVEVE